MYQNQVKKNVGTFFPVQMHKLKVTMLANLRNVRGKHVKKAARRHG